MEEFVFIRNVYRPASLERGKNSKILNPIIQSKTFFLFVSLFLSLIFSFILSFSLFFSPFLSLRSANNTHKYAGCKRRFAEDLVRSGGQAEVRPFPRGQTRGCVTYLTTLLRWCLQRLNHIPLAPFTPFRTVREHTHTHAHIHRHTRYIDHICTCESRCARTGSSVRTQTSMLC